MKTIDRLGVVSAPQLNERGPEGLAFIHRRSMPVFGALLPSTSDGGLRRDVLADRRDRPGSGMTIGEQREQRGCILARWLARVPCRLSCLRRPRHLLEWWTVGISGQGRPGGLGRNFFGSLGGRKRGMSLRTALRARGFICPGRFDDQDLHSLFLGHVGLQAIPVSRAEVGYFSRLPLARNICFLGYELESLRMSIILVSLLMYGQVCRDGWRRAWHA